MAKLTGTHGSTGMRAVRRRLVLPAFAAAALAAGTLGALTPLAQAAGGPLPEVGRCVKALPHGAKTGYNATCTKEGRGAYVFEAMPSGETAFSGVEDRQVLVFASAHHTIGCYLSLSEEPGAQPLEGEYTGPQSMLLTLNLEQCSGNFRTEEAGSLACHGAGSGEGIVRSELLEGRLGFVDATKSKPIVGWQLGAAFGSNLIEAECHGVPVTVSGSVVAEVRPTGVDKMRSYFELLLQVSKGKQAPQALEGAEPTSLSINAEGGSEPAMLVATPRINVHNLQPVEIKAL
jgi:hypothetical protein